MYVYRDNAEQPDDPAAASPAADPAEHDAAYWYDLVLEDTAPKREKVRGPFEPLVPSSGPPLDAARRQPDAARQQPAAPAGPDAYAVAGQAGTDQRTGQRTDQRTDQGQAPPDAVRDDMAQARARKLEQIKDFYLTAEAIGEQNVDKHFDQLLTQQRELISEYFRQSAAARPAVASPRDGLAAEAGAQQHDPRDRPAPEGPAATDGQAGPPEGAGVAAEHPRAW